MHEERRGHPAVEDPEDDRGRPLHELGEARGGATASPSARSAATSRRCRRPASRSTTTAPTARRCGASSRATGRSSPRASRCPSSPPSTSARTCCRSSAGRPSRQDLESAFEKIREALPAKSLPFLSRIQDLFSARPDPWKDYSKKQDVIAGLIDATLHQRQARDRLLLVQQQADEVLRPRPVPARLLPRRPLPLRARRTSTARCAPSRSSGCRRSRCSTRASRCRPTSARPSTPARPSASSGARRRRSSSSSTPEMAGYIRERNWHESQALADEAGRRRAPRAWRSRPSFDLKAWIKGFLPHVRVVRPASLRDEIAREIDARAGPPFPAPG